MTAKTLDEEHPQVMIEALIVEMPQTESHTFGVQWVAAPRTNTAISASLKLKPKGRSTHSESSVGSINATTATSSQMIPSLTQLADMLANNDAGNIVSRLTLITMNNEEAQITIGSNTKALNGSAISRQQGQPCKLPQEIGMTLQVKPVITQSGAIQLAIYFEDSAFNSKLRTTLLVENRQIFASGEITGDKITSVENCVPGLSKIPYLGNLFCRQHPIHTKDKLILFLRPEIIKNIGNNKN